MASARIGIDGPTALPPVCVCCGQPATFLRRQEFETNTAMTGAVLAASAAFGALVWTKRGVTVSLPVCDYHKRRGRRSNKTFFRGMAVTAVLGVAACVGSLFEGSAANYLSVAAMFTFIVTIVAAMSEVNDGLRVHSLAADSLTLSGVHKKFAEAVNA
jgi:hypothetical protein